MNKSKKSKMTTRELVMVVFLILLLIGVGYYMGFYTPLQQELASINGQTADMETQITAAMSKISQMTKMQDELDAILAMPEDQITEIAPYDNKDIVMAQLYSILSATQDYSLTFNDPSVQGDGTVRRNISMNFTCPSYEEAKTVLRKLADSRWRCLIGNVSFSTTGESLYDGAVSISTTLTFFESTKLERANVSGNTVLGSGM